MARIEGTGIKSPSKKSIRLAGNLGPSTPVRIDSVTTGSGSTFKRVLPDFGAGRIGEIRLKKAEADTKRPNYFSPSGGAFDERNNVQVASASGDFSGTFNEKEDFANYMKGLGIRRPKALPPTMQRMLKENYRDDIRDGFYKDGQFINKAPVQEKPSFVEQTKNLAGSIFNTVTGTQPAAASQVPGAITGGTQFSSSNLAAASAPVGSVDTGDTSFSSFRMAGQPSVQEEKKNIVTPFSQTSMGRGEPVQVTPFSATSMAKDKPTVSPSPTTPKNLAERQESKTYEQNRQKEGEKFADRGEREAINASGFQQANVRGSAFNTGKDESKRPKTVTIDGQTVAARQTVASLPSNYKQTEAQAFAKTAAFKEAQKVAARNPNVKVGVDSKGQPRATAVQKTRSEAGPSARTAQGNQARVKQNAVARAQAAAVNRKLSGTKPKTAKQRAQDAAKARKAAGPNRKMSAGQQTRSQAGASARTAQGNRARVKSNARKRAQAAARKRRAKKKGKKCDIFLKYNISPLTNMNLIRDDLAEVAYFVKEIQK